MLQSLYVWSITKNVVNRHVYAKSKGESLHLFPSEFSIFKIRFNCNFFVPQKKQDYFTSLFFCLTKIENFLIFILHQFWIFWFFFLFLKIILFSILIFCLLEKSRFIWALKQGGFITFNFLILFCHSSIKVTKNRFDAVHCVFSCKKVRKRRRERRGINKLAAAWSANGTQSKLIEGYFHTQKETIR